MSELNYDIKVNAYDDVDNHRSFRLQRVIGYVQGLIDLSNMKPFFNKIESLYDRKGLLSIKCKQKLTNKQKILFIDAWDAQGETELEFEILTNKKI